jgi:hypothetical protein
MSEGGDYTESSSYVPGHDFNSARRTYDAHSGRSYAKAVSSGKSIGDLLPDWLESNAEKLLCLLCDDTGSMLTTPGIFVSKGPYLIHEARTEYLGPDVEISVGAFGDVPNGETYPAQARPFAKGQALKTRFEELVMEGKGGSTIHENSELLALYYARRVKMPNAKNPVLVIITDEMPYGGVDPETAALVHVTLQDSITTAEIFSELKEKYSVYVILQAYNGGDDSSITAQVRKTWLKYVDEEHIASMPDANRVVDVIFGILAKEADKIDYFREEIESRQTPTQVATVYRALKTIHASALTANPSKKAPRRLNPAGKSTMFRTGGGKKTDDLT